MISCKCSYNLGMHLILLRVEKLCKIVDQCKGRIQGGGHQEPTPLLGDPQTL